MVTIFWSTPPIIPFGWNFDELVNLTTPLLLTYTYRNLPTKVSQTNVMFAISARTMLSFGTSICEDAVVTMNRVTDVFRCDFTSRASIHGLDVLLPTVEQLRLSPENRTPTICLQPHRIPIHCATAARRLAVFAIHISKRNQSKEKKVHYSLPDVRCRYWANT